MASPVSLRIIGTVLILMDLVALGYSAFNCTRPGTGCYSGGMCDMSNGGCICMGSDFTGYNCLLERQYIMHGSCLSNNPCHNGGTCYDRALVGSRGYSECYCPYDFYGEYCEMPRVQSECFRDQMIVNINPSDTFDGNIFVSTSVPGVSCGIPKVSMQPEFTLDPVRSKWHGYASVLPYAGTACGATPNVTTTPTEVIITYDVMVQYDKMGLNPQYDEVISFSCPRPNINAGPIGPTAVLFTVTDRNGAMVSRPKLGDAVTISFDVDPSSIFTDILIQSCTVTSPAGTVFKPVVKDSCPVHPVGKRLEKRGSTHVLTLVMHMIGHDPRLNFDCDVKVCTVSDTSCQKQPYCPVVPSHSHSTGHGMGAPMGGPHDHMMSADPHAHGGSPSHDLLSLMGGGGSGGVLDSIMGGAMGGTGGAGGGGGASMTLQDLMSGLTGGTGGSSHSGAASSGTSSSGTGGTGGTGGSGTGGDQFLDNLMSMVGGTSVMNDLVFGGSTGPMMGGVSGGDPMGAMGGGMGGMSMGGMTGRRRRRDVSEDEPMWGSGVVRVSGSL